MNTPTTTSAASPSITLIPVTPDELPDLIIRMQHAFAQAVREQFGTSEPIPSAAEIEKAHASDHSDVYHIQHKGKRVGGAVITTHQDSGRNSLDLFFIDLGQHSRGLGLAAWQAIEAHYPNTRVWETVTPYFEQRNIHFYINKCGFRAVEFFNSHHHDPQHPAPADGTPEPPGMEAFFRFEKEMGNTPTDLPLHEANGKHK